MKKCPVLVAIREPVPSKSCQLHQAKVAYLVLNERHVEHSGQLVLVRLDTPNKVRGLCG